MKRLKKIFKLVRKGLVNPRNIIAAYAYPLQRIIPLILLSILFLAAGEVSVSQELIGGLSNNMSTASKHLPEFNYILGNLKLADQAKPLYYQSKSFQLVIDDTIQATKDQNDVGLTPDQKAQIDDDTFLSLFFFKDKSYAQLGGNLYAIPQALTMFRSPNNLTMTLNYMKNHQFQVSLYFLLAFSMVHGLMYVIYMAITAMLLGFYNMRLSVPLSFLARFKLASVAGFYPSFVLGITNLILPLFPYPYPYILGFVLIYIYIMLREHTKHVHKIYHKLTGQEMTPEDVEKMLKESQNNETQVDTDSPSRSQKNLNDSETNPSPINTQIDQPEQKSTDSKQDEDKN